MLMGRDDSFLVAASDGCEEILTVCMLVSLACI
ncbi:hypothetical protein COMA1_11241 [Candidatus Nitrospira nitrosa]|uniref:PPM-type phosphatase domain-containing protein n=1 Tax=Candidatus Nitrospira nitrosa TaxID=1742972 RepID=A0A0S4LAG4_9BACT|nr:hypothetical protein COMA1_11241 [Candidatus Nitrospira nitrosa]